MATNSIYCYQTPSMSRQVVVRFSHLELLSKFLENLRPPCRRVLILVFQVLCGCQRPT